MSLNPTKLLNRSLARYIRFVLVLLVLSLISLLPIFESINVLFTDRLHGAIPVRDSIIIVGIDDQSLAEIGAWPWDRTIFAQALNNLDHKEVRVVAIDVLLIESREGDEELVRVAENLDYHLLLASKLIENSVIESKFIGTPNLSSAYTNFRNDRDGKVRVATLTEEVSGQCLPSFAYATLLKYYNRPFPTHCGEFVDILPSLTSPSNIEFIYSDQKFRQISFQDLYNDQVDPAILKDSIVLIGSTAKDLKSNLSDNFLDIGGQQVSGVEVHASVINSLLEDRYLTPINPILFLTLTLLLCVSVYAAYRWLDRVALELSAHGLILLGSFVAGIILFDFGVKWPYVQFVFILSVAYIYLTLERYLQKRNESRVVQDLFGQYVNKNLLAEIMTNRDKLNLEGENREMSVLFSDVRSFTTMSEDMDPKFLLTLLNSYLEKMSDSILNNNGTIDKFIGDGIMAFWNAPLNDPDHRLHALQCALEMQKQLRKFNKEHPEYPDLKVGIGINTGVMSVGSIGSNRRFDYTVLGDNVNLGSRIEGLTKKYNVPILAAHSTVESVITEAEKIGIIFRVVDKVAVKGKKHPVTLYEPMKANKHNIDLCERFAKAFELYSKGEFRRATSYLEHIKKDGPAKVLLERIENNKFDEGWNGTWIWNEK